MRNIPIKLRDIAEIVKVSRMTVSMALRDDPRVSRATQRRIREVATKLGYVPNAKLGKLMSEMARSSKTVEPVGELAFITSFNTEFGWQQSYHLSACFEGARRQAEALGYQLTPFWSLSKRFKGRSLSELLWARGIEGVIIAPLGDRIFISHETSLSFDWQRFCNVQIGATLANPALHLVRHNHFFGMMLCLEQLEALGYRRIGLALSKVGDLRSHHLWCSSYLHWRALRGMTQQLPYLIFDAELDTRKLAHWLKHYRIEAVVAMDTVPLDVIRSLNLSVPGDIGFATLDHNNRDNTISGIDQYAEEIGSSAVNQLVQSIRHGDRGIPSMPNQVLVGGKWIAGQTTRRRRKISHPKQKMMDQPMPTEV